MITILSFPRSPVDSLRVRLQARPMPPYLVKKKLTRVNAVCCALAKLNTKPRRVGRRRRRKINQRKVTSRLDYALQLNFKRRSWILKVMTTKGRSAGEVRSPYYTSPGVIALRTRDALKVKRARKSRSQRNRRVQRESKIWSKKSSLDITNARHEKFAESWLHFLPRENGSNGNRERLEVARLPY